MMITERFYETESASPDGCMNKLICSKKASKKAQIARKRKIAWMNNFQANFSLNNVNADR